MLAEPTNVLLAEPTIWLTDAEQQVWRQLLSVDCRLRERLDHELHVGAGLTLGEYEVLVHLSEAPARALRMSELAERLVLSRSGMTRRVDGLVKAGLVARRPCDDDGRGALAELTATGFERLERAAPVHVGGIRRYLFGPMAGTGSEDGSGGLASVAGALARIERALGNG